MEDFVLIVLVIGFIAVLIRQGQFSHKLRELEEMYRRILRSIPQTQEPPPLPPTATAVPSRYVAPPPPAVPPTAPAAPTIAQVPPPPVTAAYTYKPSYITAPPPPAAKPVAPVFATPPAPPAEPKPRVSLEARLGQNWLNKLGITAMVIGIALYLGYQLHNLGPIGKSLVGLVIALAILGLGIFLERKPNYRIFARACIGGGWALLFFLSFAIYHLPLLQVLHSSLVDLILMLLVASGMVAHSLRYHSQTITTLAFLLALLTVGLSDVTIFSLIAGALLTAALAVLVYRERWFLLGLVGLIGVYVNHGIWLYRVLPEGGLGYLRSNGHSFPEFVPSALLLLAYWLTFRIVYVFRAPLEGASYREQQSIAGFAAILNSVGLLSLLKYQSSHPEWAFAALLAFGAVELTLAILARGTVTLDDQQTPRNRPAFIVLSTIASVVLLAAIPFRFHGASWSLLWLLEAEAFLLAGIRLPESIFRRIGILASLITGVLVAINSFALIAAGSLFGVGYAQHHPIPVLITGALVLWLNAELATRLAPSITESDFDNLVLRVSSFLAALLAALAITITLHPGSAWLCVGWLVLSLLLAEIASRLHSTQLATQSDLLAVSAVFATVAINFQLDAHTPGTFVSTHISLQLLTVSLMAVLLYLGTRRRLASYLLTETLIAPVYTWAAAALVTALCWFQFSHLTLAVAWGVFALVLFELGIRFNRSYLRHQGYVVLAFSFIRIFFANLNWYDGYLPHPHGTLSPALYTVIPLVAAFAYVYERTQSSAVANEFDRLVGTLFAWAGLIAAGSLLYTELRADWVILGWTLLSITTLAIAAALKRSLFVAQSYVALAAVFLRGLFVLSLATPASGFYNSRPFTIGLTSALLLLTLTIAFHLRRHYVSRIEGSSRPESERSADVAERPASSAATDPALILHHPEQPFFFAPLTLLTLLLYVQLHGGLITIGWVALGLATFLFALTVSQRSYRLSGLGLLLLGVAKILLWDVWQAPPAERYLTLIIMGAALLLVSFLYSRYRETLLKFL